MKSACECRREVSAMSFNSLSVTPTSSMKFTVELLRTQDLRVRSTSFGVGISRSYSSW